MSKSDKLFVTDAECAARIGISTEDFKAMLPTLEKSGFPVKDPSFNEMHYWPAIKAYLDKRAGLASDFVRRPRSELVVKDGKLW